MAIIAKETIAPCRDSFVFEFEKDKINQTIDDITKEIGKRFTIKGFRKGKAPASAIKIAAKDTILQEIKRRLTSEAYQEILYETSLKPFGEPEVLKVDASFSEFKLQLNISYMPSFEIGQYKDFNLDRPNMPTDEELINNAVSNLCKQHYSLRPFNEDDFIVDGDTIVVNYISKINGKDFDNNSASDLLIEVGAGKYLREFETSVMGMKINEKRQFDIGFPEKGTVSKIVAGKTISFDVELKSAFKKEYSDFNEDLAIKLGLENFEALNKKVLEHVEQQKKSIFKNSLKVVVFDKLLEGTTIDIPEWMIEKSAMVLSQSKGLKWEENDAEIKKYFMKEGLNTLKLSMIFDKIRENEIETVLTEQEIQSILLNNLGKLPEDVQKNLFDKQNINTLSKIYSEIQDEQVFEWIIKNSTIKEPETETKGEIKAEENSQEI